VVVKLCLVTHYHPHFFDPIIAEHIPQAGDFPEFGGMRTAGARSLIPTGETALILLAGMDINQRLSYHYLLEKEHILY
jgi:hypothetical protein